MDYNSIWTGQEIDSGIRVAKNTSNRNLLDNPWFTINQRQATAYNAAGTSYGVDRWRGWDLHNADITNDGIAFTSSGILYQPLSEDLIAQLSGESVTVSILLSDGTVMSGTNTFSASKAFINSTSIYVQITQYYNLDVAPKQSMTIRAVKLELGNVSTLANDLAPDYGDELMKCQRYFYRVNANPNAVRSYIASGLTNGNNAYFVITLPAEMRISPTLRTANVHVYRGITGEHPETTTIGIETVDAKNKYVTLRCNISSIGAAASTPFLLEIYQDGYLEFSAEL